MALTKCKNGLRLGGAAMLVAAVVFSDVVIAFGQMLPPAATQSPLTLEGPGHNSALFVHRDALGRPCLDFEAAARAHIINPNVYDHVVSIYNRCLGRIQVRVCYYQTHHCIDVDMPGLQRKDVILGVYPSMRFFRYSYREKP